MASPLNAVLCALLATAFWTFLGYTLARHLFPRARALALGAAAVVGWAVHSAAALPVFILIGFSPPAVIAIGALSIVLGSVSLSLRAPARGSEGALRIPLWTFAAAAVLALAPAAAILPKFSGEAVALADPIFDHAKVAVTDVIARLGVPPVNPAFAEAGAPDRLAYYYLWHFSAAELALVLRTTGWEADIGLTWFTAFASLALMMGLAVFLSKRSAAAVWVVVSATAGSLWVTLDWIVGADDLSPLLWPPIGMAGWLFQATWVPQHVMAAACAIIAMALMTECVSRRTPALLATLALAIVAGFESSTFVGGVTFAIAALAATPILLAAAEERERPRFIAAMAAVAVVVFCFVAPFVLDQWAAVRSRGSESPIIISHYTVFGELVPLPLRRVLDIPGYWLIILPCELPAAYVAGVVALIAAWRGRLAGAEKLLAAVFACLVGAGLMVSWLLVSTLGGNNDLGLRAFIPAEIVLVVGAAAWMSAVRRGAIVTITLAGLALSLPDTARMIGEDIFGRPRPGGEILARSPELWAAVRRHAAPGARVANNPRFVGDLTPWPVNISWALLANRSSCFAGRELAVALAPLSPQRREAIDAQFIRVFDGEGTPDDVREMAAKYGCDVVVIVPQDKAWDKNDAFAASPDYRLAEAREDRWRIYVRAPR
jgi:hypothetical protein